MVLKAALRQNGHSVGLILPKNVLTHLGATKGDSVFLTFMTDRAVHLSLADPEFEEASVHERQSGGGVCVSRAGWPVNRVYTGVTQEL